MRINASVGVGKRSDVAIQIDGGVIGFDECVVMVFQNASFAWFVKISKNDSHHF